MKNYIVTIGEKSFEIEALNIKSANDIAQFNKRMLKIKGITNVRLIK